MRRGLEGAEVSLNTTVGVTKLTRTGPRAVHSSGTCFAENDAYCTKTENLAREGVAQCTTTKFE